MEKKKRKWLKISGIIAIVLIGMALFYVQLNFTGLNGWARQYEKITVPQETTIIKYGKVKGRLGVGNRDWEDYGVYWIVASNLDRKELFDYYAKDIPEAGLDILRPLKKQIAVMTQEETEIYDFMNSVQMDNDIAQVNAEDYLPQQIYVVMIYERGRSAFYH